MDWERTADFSHKFLVIALILISKATASLFPTWFTRTDLICALLPLSTPGLAKLLPAGWGWTLDLVRGV